MTLFIIILLLVMQLQIAAILFYTVRGAVPVRKRQTKPVFIDTSVLIDGRIALVAQTGFIPNRIVIPKSVLAELQLLADGGDSVKRSRARHGLDIANQLRELGVAEIMDDGDASRGVDEQLLYLAKKYDGAICTTDFNLNKVAQVESIQVLNLNELAQQIRVNYLPGEKVSLEIAQKGNDAQQGVGYLADGTMVVVEKAKADIGKTVEIEFIRTIQTAAGRMLFAKKITTTKSQRSSPKSLQRSKPASSEDRLVELANN